MPLVWYINRLRSMSGREVLHRVIEALKKRSPMWKRARWNDFPGDGRPPNLPGLRTAVLANANPIDAKAIAIESNSIRSGNFSSLGLNWPRRIQPSKFSEADWRIDPVTGYLWPGADTYCFDIKYRHERKMGDVKYVWEFNRLQFLQCLACDVLINGNLSSLEVIEDALISWHRYNRPFYGLGWNSGIELALRAISLLIVSSLIGDRLSPPAVRCLRSMLHAQLFWILRFPSKYSSSNNHLVAEAAGAFLITTAMPEFDKEGSQNAISKLLVEKEVLKQIYLDGSGAEQSPSYAAFTAELALLCAVVARNTNQPMSHEFDQRLDRFRIFVQWLGEPKLTIPAIGDDDEGRVITFGSSEVDYVKSVCLAIGSYQNSTSGVSASRGSQLRELMFGVKSDKILETSNLKTFGEGGLTIIRKQSCGRDFRLVFDHGPLGYLNIAAHGHADALSIIVDLDGMPFLIDSGTYLYHSGGKWRDWFRSTPAHNTLNIGGTSQSRITGPFNWSKPAVATLISIQDGLNLTIEGSHDGYYKKFGSIHHRRFTYKDFGFEICDRLEGQSQISEIVFQFAPHLKCVQRDDRTIDVWNGDWNTATLVLPPAGKTDMSFGLENGLGWMSPRFGIRVAAWRVGWLGKVDELGVLTEFRLDKNYQLDQGVP